MLSRPSFFSTVVGCDDAGGNRPDECENLERSKAVSLKYDPARVRFQHLQSALMSALAYVVHFTIQKRVGKRTSLSKLGDGVRHNKSKITRGSEQLGDC
jgi:hypothetical protein